MAECVQKKKNSCMGLMDAEKYFFGQDIRVNFKIFCRNNVRNSKTNITFAKDTKEPVQTLQ